MLQLSNLSFPPYNPVIVSESDTLEHCEADKPVFLFLFVCCCCYCFFLNPERPQCHNYNCKLLFFIEQSMTVLQFRFAIFLTIPSNENKVLLVACRSLCETQSRETWRNVSEELDALYYSDSTGVLSKASERGAEASLRKDS